MENVVDRKAYRRNVTNDSEYIINRNKKNIQKNYTFINQVINSLLILLFILLLKLFEYEKTFRCIEELFFSGIPYETLEMNIKQKYNEVLNINKDYIIKNNK